MLFKAWCRNSQQILLCKAVMFCASYMSATDISYLVDFVLVDCEILKHPLSSTLSHLP